MSNNPDLAEIQRLQLERDAARAELDEARTEISKHVDVMADARTTINLLKAERDRIAAQRDRLSEVIDKMRSDARDAKELRRDGRG